MYGISDGLNPFRAGYVPKIKEEVLNLQYWRGKMDAFLGNASGEHNEACAYPNPKHMDVSRQEASEAYLRGWNHERALRPLKAKTNPFELIRRQVR